MKLQHYSLFQSLNEDYKPQIPAKKYMLKVSIRSTRKTSRRRSGVFIVNFEHISHLFCVSVIDFTQVYVC